MACGREKKAIKSTVRGMELFPSSDEEEEENTFMGFTQQEILEVYIKLEYPSVVHMHIIIYALYTVYM